MVSYYVDDQEFGWNIEPQERYDEFSIKFAPAPRIALINNSKRWYNFDRSGMDAVVYWTTEGLGHERTDGHPIVPLGSTDIIFSSSDGPNSTVNLNYWFFHFLEVYNSSRIMKFFPDPCISENKLFCALGDGRLPRCYAWCRLLDENLVENNLISFVSENYRWSTQADVTNELSGQEEMSRYVRKNWHRIPVAPVRFEDDWRWMKMQKSWYGLTRSGFHASMMIPTKVVNKSSLSLVLETLLHDQEFFITEKTVKALISGRPSIIVACRNNMDMIRNLGFRTWDGIIDESYQRLVGPKNRIDSAIFEAKRVINWNILEHPESLAEARRIADHNLNHLLTHDWSANIRNAIKSIKEKIGIQYD